MSATAHLVRALSRFRAGRNVFNPWADVDPLLDISNEAPRIRARNLTAYLDERMRSARLLLLAEAAGYRGCHVSGLPMTSERLLLGFGRPAIDPDAIFRGKKTRLTRPDSTLGGKQGVTEPTASTVWGTLLGAGIDPRSFVLWNTFPFHPHQPGRPHSNRAPSRSELEGAHEFLPQLLALFVGDPMVVAVGRIAQRASETIGISCFPVRHPSQGGASVFRAEVLRLLRNQAAGKR